MQVNINLAQANRADVITFVRHEIITIKTTTFPIVRQING